MFGSIKEDMRAAFAYGHMVNKLIIINVVVFVVLALIEAFTRNLGVYQPIIENIAMPTEAIKLLFKPWTLFSYMFTQEGFWHLLWNMIGLNIFGRIIGDLIGDNKVLPIYIWGGLAGAFLVVILTPLLSNLFGNYMVGASAAISAIAMVGAIIAPDYNIRLLLIGNVRLKYIVLAFLIFSLIQSQGLNNAGGAYAHLGGMIFGILYTYLLRSGTDLADPINRVVSWIQNLSSPQAPIASKKKSVLRVEHRSAQIRNPTVDEENDYDLQLDAILEKIKKVGYDKLSKREKDFLNQASQK